MKAFWLFSTNAGDGSEDDPNRPALPAGVGGRWTCPGDVIRLTGSPVPHTHLLVGGVALPDDNLGDGHRHYVVKVAGSWQQLTVGATSHTHTLNLNAAGGLNPDYFLLFWAGSDANAAAIASDPNCYPVAEASVVSDGEGGWTIDDLDNTQWTSAQQSTWESRMLDVLGVQLPSQVDRGARLVKLFLGVLLSRQADNETAYRRV